MPSELTSSTLLLAVRNPTDQAAWRTFESRYRPEIARWCRQMGASQHDADDVAQNVLVKLLSKLSHYQRSKGRFRSWLAKVAANCWRDLMRQQKRQLPPAWRQLSDQFSDVIVTEHDREVLEDALARIQPRVSKRNWRAFRLITYDGMDASAVAGQLGCTKTAVYQAVYRIREMIKAEIEFIEEHVA